MASTAQSIATAPAEDLSMFRLYVLRAVYALIAFGEGSIVVPDLFIHGPTARGVIPAMLSGLCLMCLLGLRYPRQMLPLCRRSPRRRHQRRRLRPPGSPPRCRRPRKRLPRTN